MTNDEIKARVKEMRAEAFRMLETMLSLHLMNPKLNPAEDLAYYIKVHKAKIAKFIDENEELIDD